MNFLRFKTFYLLFSGLLIAGSIVALAVFGLQLGIEFTGGGIIHAEYEDTRPQIAELRQEISGLGLGSSTVQPAGELGVLVRAQDISPEAHERVLDILGPEATELKFESIGPVIGKELREKVFLMLLLSGIAILLYIAFAFRKSAEPLSAWQFSLSSFLPLLHDILVPLGILSLLGVVLNMQVTIPIVVALLTVVGYSINNTVVTFDRIREVLLRQEGKDFPDAINRSVRQTFSRNINTSFSTLLVLLALLFFGGDTLAPFALTLVIGIVAGTYSSLFLAPSFLYIWGKRANT